MFPLTQKIREALQLDSYHDDDCFLQNPFLFLFFVAEGESERKKKKEKEGENLSRHENPEVIFFDPIMFPRCGTLFTVLVVHLSPGILSCLRSLRQIRSMSLGLGHQDGDQ